MRSDAREIVLTKLAEGIGLMAICAEPDMPDRATVQRWQLADADFGAAVMRAREDGYHARAEQAVRDAKAAEDPQKGRLAFDAERWYLGKLSNAFSDRQKHEHTGKDGGPIETAGKLDVSGISDAALREIAAARADDSR